jgi:hypothetical protein
VDFPFEEVVGQIILGSENFLKKVNLQLNEEKLNDMFEVPREQQLTLVPGLDEIFQSEMRNGAPRDEIIHRAYYEYNFTMKQIGEYLGLHYTTISRVINQYEKN